MAAAFTLFTPVEANAQYFGQNKVQYGDFDFRVLATEHFDIYYYPVEADAARDVARMAERWYGRLSAVLAAPLVGRQIVILYASHADFEQTNVLEGLIPEETGGVTEGVYRRVILPLAGSMAETDHVLGHELVHAFQYSILGRESEGMPLWFMEGMAEYLSLGSRDPQTAMWLRDALIREDLPTLDTLDDPRYFPYRFGHALWSFIGTRWTDRAIGRILVGVAGVPTGSDPFGPVTQMHNSGGDPIRAIEIVTGLKKDVLSAQWHESIGALYAPALAQFPPTPTDNVLVLAGKERGSLRIGPALSPDGRRIAFLSERDRLSIELYVADAHTGEIERALTKTTADPHFDSLHFVESAGAWAPDNERLAIAAAHAGKPVLAILSAKNGNRLREIPFPTLSAIFQPSWSPDGQKIAFTGQVGGMTNLYAVDLTTGQLSQLTHDAFADLEPAWAPNSRDLAFTTDRFGNDVRELSSARYSLAVLNTTTGEISEVQTGLTGNAVNAQWSSTGDLFFVSDATGRPDVYRRRSGTSTSELAASVATGISGITPLSPALSVSADGAVAFSIFSSLGYAIYVFPAAPEGRPTPTGTLDLARLSGGDGPSLVTEQLRQPREYLPPADPAPAEPSRASAKLHLMDMRQQIGASSSTGAFGTYVSGGVSFLFSDVLGNHLLSTGINVTGSVKDFAAQASYLNRTSRWNWGVFGERVPLTTGTISSGITDIDGQTVYVEASNLHREIYSQLGVLTAYPFNRSTRLEFSTSVRHIGFQDELTTQIFDPTTGDFLGHNTTDLGGSPGLNMADVTAALVGDAATFGGLGPVVGQRYRLEMTPIFGDLQMVSTTLDYRRYVMPVRPLTFAVRLMHIARYGESAEDPRLSPFFLGYNTFVRGYDVNSFSATECSATPDGSCPEFDRLSGSRLAVANFEARVPLLGLFNGKFDYGPVPAELFAFFDAGVAWMRDTKPTFAGGEQPWIRSAGAGVRVNLLGFAIGEFNLVRAVDRSGRGWDFVFNLRPGF